MYVQRAALALDGLALRGRVLDLGAGSGVLYDKILESGCLVDYVAVDASEAMIAQSRIPCDKVVMADMNILPDLGQFDLIFALGLTTYLEDETIRNWPSWLSSSLKPGGQAIITFTHEASWQWRIRGLLRRLPFLPAHTSLGSGLRIYASTPEKQVFPGCSVKRTVGFNHILNKGRFRTYSKRTISPWYSDFLLHLEKDQ
jgi:SAM-dependent methyltransferase